MTNSTSSGWKAFIDLQPILQTPGGTLRVIGTVDTQNTNEAKLLKREPQGINPTILLLEVIEVDTLPVKNPQEVRYEEGLMDKEQYSSIEIFFGEDLLTKIDEIKEVQ